MENYMQYLPYFWLAVIIFAVIVESVTAQLVSIWFVAGGIGALIASVCNLDFWWQLFIFVVVTAVTLVATKPLVKKVIRVKKTQTNADRYIGKSATVITEINNMLGQGQVNVSGNVWTARSLDNTVIQVNQEVIIKSIEGVKLIVDVIQ
jgi:membrane protein implicated in regulation of membrane protease activity